MLRRVRPDAVISCISFPLATVGGAADAPPTAQLADYATDQPLELK
jgi:hypothetical protein